MTTICLDYEPRDWQRQCHREKKRFTVLALHRRAGKTELAIMELLNKAMKCSEPLPLFVYVAPYLKQAKTIAWARLKRKVEPLRVAGVVEVNEGDLAITFTHNGAGIRIFGADNPDALRGMRLDGVVIDEVAHVKPEVWNDIVQPALSDRRGWAVFIGTPAGVNLFSELFFRAQSLPDWHSAKWTVYETDALQSDEVERLRRDMPEGSFRREYECDFTAAGDDQLISLVDVEVASKRVYVARDVMGAPRILGVDPARFGDDRSVIVKRQGLQMFTPLVYRGLDNMDLAARVAAVISEWQPDATFIDSGAGAGVIDRLRQLGHSVIEVPFGGKATQPHLFVNRRTEMWWGMREWLVSGGAIPNETALKQELATPIYWFDAAGRKVLEPKDEVKKRLMGAGSPDIADALALTFAAPVHARNQFDALGLHRRRNPRQEYDPYAFLERGWDYDPFEPRAVDDDLFGRG
jgi:hypothetical protein